MSGSGASGSRCLLSSFFSLLPVDFYLSLVRMGSSSGTAHGGCDCAGGGVRLGEVGSWDSPRGASCATPLASRRRHRSAGPQTPQRGSCAGRSPVQPTPPPARGAELS
eukprot:2845067-Rhodomonas_salina.1